MIPLTGTGGLFTRIGIMLGTLNSVNTFRGTTLQTATNDLMAQFGSTDQIVVTNYLPFFQSYQGLMSSMPSMQQSLAINTVIQMVQDDSGSVNPGSLSSGLAYLIAQMKSASQTVQSTVLGGSIAYSGSNIGNAIITFSNFSFTGLLQENLFAENVACVVTQDSQTGGAVSGSEVWNFRGGSAASSSLLWTYPAGSGCNASVRAVNPSQPAFGGTSNYLVNSNFESWTSNVPNNWHVVTGVPGTTILQETSHVYDGLSSLGFVGNGSELTAINQQFSLRGPVPVTGDTPVVMLPSDQMGFNVFIYLSSVPAAGVISFSLVSGPLTSSTVINDAQGNPCTISYTLSTSSSGFWIPVNGYFRTPAVLPSAVYLLVKLTTALSAGTTLFMDRMGLAEPLLLYRGGSSVNVWSGNTPSILADRATFTPTNTYAAGFQLGFQKFFNMSNLGLLLPYSGSPTISDGLITT